MSLFSLFKSKPTLTNLIPNDQVDIHSHLLFGLDDGAKTIEDSLLLAEHFTKAGYSQCIVTPHVMNTLWENTAEGITARCQELQLIFQQNGVPLKLRPAAEYQMDTGFLSLAKEKKLLTLRENWVLVEMSYLNPPINLYDILFQLQVEGYQPILAHPERYVFYANQTSEYKKLKNAGCRFQMNLLSAVGYYGKMPSQIADYLLGEGLIDFVGSDWHHLNHAKAIERPVALKNIKALEKALDATSIFRF